MRKLIFFVLPVVLGLTLASGETYPSDVGRARLLGTSDEDSGFDIAVDSNGNSYITGKTKGDLDGKTNAGSVAGNVGSKTPYESTDLFKMVHYKRLLFV